MLSFSTYPLGFFFQNIFSKLKKVEIFFFRKVWNFFFFENFEKLFWKKKSYKISWKTKHFLLLQFFWKFQFLKKWLSYFTYFLTWTIVVQSGSDIKTYSKWNVQPYVTTYKMDQNVVYCNIKGLHMHQNFVLELFEFHWLIHFYKTLC
jgi:hypothetical protein